MFTQHRIDDIHQPKPGLTMAELIALRAAEPVELDHLRRADHNRRKKALFAARRAKLAGHISEWKVQSDRPGRWFICRTVDGRTEYVCSKHGYPVLFASEAEAAQHLTALQGSEIGHSAPKSDK